MKKRFLIFVFALVIAFLWSQTAEIDSLKNKIQSVKLQPEEKAETLLQLARNYWWQNPDSSLLYVEQAESLSKENNLRELLSKTYNYWGISYEFKEEYENAIFYYNKALEYSYKIEDKEQKAYAIYNLGYVRSLMGEDEKAIEKYKEAIEAYRVVQDSISMAQCMQNIAELYENKNDYDKGLEYYKKAKEIFIAKQDSARIASNEIMIGSIYLELSNFEYSLASLLTALDLLKALNNETGLATVYNMLGNLYHEMQNYDKALEYYEFSLEKNIELGNEDGVSVAYNNIGVIYDEQGDYETALEYYTKSYKSDLERGDKSGVATALNNIGVVHRSMGNNSVALEKLHESLKISEEVEDKNSIANTCSNIAEIYISQDKLEKAKTYLERAAKIADEIQINSLLMKVNHVYFKYYSQRGQFEKAMDYQDRYYAIKDSIYTFNNQNILELQTQHAIEQQERELELLRRREELNKLKISTHKRVRRFFIVIIFLVIVVAAILYYQFKLKKRNSDFLDKVINSLPHPFMIINADTREIEIMNRKASDENLNFYDYDSAKKKYIRKKETPFDIDLILNEEQNNVLVSDYKIENKNGTRYYEIHAYAIKNKGENIKKVIEYAFDVTDRKMAEEKIKQSEAKFRSLFEGASDAILILKGNRFIQCNKQAMELYGVREEQDLIGSTPVDFSPEYQIDGCRSADGASKKIKKALQGENTIFEWRHVKKNGEYFDAEISLNLLEIDGEKYVQAIVRDITKRLQTQRALEESKAKNTAILEAIPDMMFVFDKKAVFQEVHNLSESELAKPVDEFLGKVVSEVIPKKTADMY
ncbi:MAG: tetratricopeptide repeat protein, partial [Candidatus Cloacimonadota bacterium]|nr:tetratricopeptide repeat protein [Candidatus Cloacimonadota bacterium]